MRDPGIHRDPEAVEEALRAAARYEPPIDMPEGLIHAALERRCPPRRIAATRWLAVAAACAVAGWVAFGSHAVSTTQKSPGNGVIANVAAVHAPDDDARANIAASHTPDHAVAVSSHTSAARGHAPTVHAVVLHAARRGTSHRRFAAARAPMWQDEIVQTQQVGVAVRAVRIEPTFMTGRVLMVDAVAILPLEQTTTTQVCAAPAHHNAAEEVLHP